MDMRELLSGNSGAVLLTAAWPGEKEKRGFTSLCIYPRFSPHTLVCIYLLKRYLLHRGTLVFDSVSEESIKKYPVASRRPNDVSLVPFDSPDPVVSKRCIDFRQRRWKWALLLSSSFLPWFSEDKSATEHRWLRYNRCAPYSNVLVQH